MKVLCHPGGREPVGPDPVPVRFVKKLCQEVVVQGELPFRQPMPAAACFSFRFFLRPSPFIAVKTGEVETGEYPVLSPAVPL